MKAPAKKAAKKVVQQAAVQTVAKKAPAKKAAKKEAKKAPAKKVAKKAPAKKAAKKVAKKAPAKKVVKKAPAAPKPAEKAVTKKAAKPAPAKSAVQRDPAKPLSKTQMVAIVAETCGVEKKKVAAIMDFIPELINNELKKPGIFQFPGLLKIEKKKIPAQKAIKGWKNPFTGEIGTKPAKPACNKIKVRPLKKLKDMA